eukprot:scaffold85209_cov34-Tisochrysis_lutea.AAC.3
MATAKPTVPPPSQGYIKEQRASTRKLLQPPAARGEGSRKTSFMDELAAYLCCQDIKPKADVTDIFLGAKAADAPGLFDRICFCESQPKARKLSRLLVWRLCSLRIIGSTASRSPLTSFHTIAPRGDFSLLIDCAGIVGRSTNCCTWRRHAADWEHTHKRDDAHTEVV